MRKISITESQFKRLFENGPLLDDSSDIKEFGNPSEISTTAPIHDTDGNLEYGNPPDTDQVAKRLSYQNWWANSTGGARINP
jgi:hypothetical protein